MLAAGSLHGLQQLQRRCWTLQKCRLQLLHHPSVTRKEKSICCLFLVHHKRFCVCPQVFIGEVVISHRGMIMMTVMLLSCPKCQCHQAAGGKSHTQHTMRLFYQQFNGSTHIPYSHICDDLWVCSFKWQALAAVICVKVRLQGAGVGARGSWEWLSWISVSQQWTAPTPHFLYTIELTLYVDCFNSTSIKILNHLCLSNQNFNI